MRRRALLLVESQPGPVPSALLVQELLGIRAAPPELARKLLEPVLAEEPRIERSGADAWTLAEPGARGTARSTPVLWPWIVWSASPGLEIVAAVRLEGGEITSEATECGPAARALLGSTAEERSGERAYGRARFAAPRPGQRLATSNRRLRTALTATSAARLGSLGEGCLWATAEEPALWKVLRSRLLDAGALASPPAFSLRRLALAALGPPRPRSLREIAERLESSGHEMTEPLDRARLASRCLLRLLEAPALALARDAEELVHLVRRAPPEPDLTGTNFDAAWLSGLPREPGVYRFYDSRGDLLYVGKARDLRRRITSYFSARSAPDPRTAAWLPRVHDIEIDRTGSELEALLREAETIVRAAPAANVQRAVRPRRIPSTGNFLLFLPDTEAGGVRAHLVRDGALRARVRLGPRRGGQDRLRALMRKIYFDLEGAGTPRGWARRKSQSERSRGLISSWLRRQDRLVPAFDPTESAGPDEAFEIALRYAESVRRGEADVLHR